MSGIKELSVDQMAVLGLVLRQERPYAELAGMLDMDEAEMRRRAHEALDALGPDDGAGLPAERRAEIGDYLLGQRGDDERTETRRFLEESAPGRAWARTVADQLSELKDPLPEIPDGPADEAGGAAAPAPPPPPAPVGAGAGAAAATAAVAPVPSEAAWSAPPPAAVDGDGERRRGRRVRRLPPARRPALVAPWWRAAARRPCDRRDRGHPVLRPARQRRRWRRQRDAGGEHHRHPAAGAGRGAGQPRAAEQPEEPEGARRRARAERAGPGPD